VYSHNPKCHDPIRLEDTWATKTLIIRFFAFLLAISEINVYLSYKVFNNNKEKENKGMLEF
jgi:hypothetical protein